MSLHILSLLSTETVFAALADFILTLTPYILWDSIQLFKKKSVKS